MVSGVFRFIVSQHRRDRFQCRGLTRLMWGDVRYLGIGRRDWGSGSGGDEGWAGAAYGVEVVDLV